MSSFTFTPARESRKTMSDPWPSGSNCGPGIDVTIRSSPPDSERTWTSPSSPLNTIRPDATIMDSVPGCAGDGGGDSPFPEEPVHATSTATGMRVARPRHRDGSMPPATPGSDLAFPSGERRPVTTRG
jgi:hypothetical protein